MMHRRLRHFILLPETDVLGGNKKTKGGKVSI